MGIFKTERATTKYIPYPQNYPMGAFTFAIACATCKHYKLGAMSKRCQKCRKEIESGYETIFPTEEAIEALQRMWHSD